MDDIEMESLENSSLIMPLFHEFHVCEDDDNFDLDPVHNSLSLLLCLITQS